MHFAYNVMEVDVATGYYHNEYHHAFNSWVVVPRSSPSSRPSKQAVRARLLDELREQVRAREMNLMHQASVKFYHARVMQELLVVTQKRREQQDNTTAAATTNSPSTQAKSSPLTQPLSIPDVDSKKTVFFFDFDDTLMATTYFERTDMFTMSEMPQQAFAQPSKPVQSNSREAAQLAQIDALVVEILRESAMHGDVLIVTNAGHGWVEHATSKYLPNTRKYITSSSTKVISARSKYSRFVPSDAASEWKVHCFSDELERIVPDMRNVNMLVLGDSISDQYAAHSSFAKLERESSLLKFVKFAEKPSPAHLVYQLKVLKQNLYNLVYHRGSFDVNVTKPSSAESEH
eukprot:CAMPEP_0184706480 /NCGR_PEP_ID=MMETSP0313-20130426/36777_1 /TAXON_ID=2792 /ORGANISM="Porphyridium aerugineum, Strain SAG 1380-2" /LENGTH=345 /DNA_ID=CAMNT_0027168033 /DNA_START=358 /DNA_END=1395 /DNA_ORIENTATION=-